MTTGARVARDVSGSSMRAQTIGILRVPFLLMVIGLPVLMLYGAFVPWQIADDALAENHGFPKLLIGYGYHRLSGNTGIFEKISRTYLIVPRSLSIPYAVTVVSTNGEIQVVSNRPAGIVIPSAYVLALFGGWWWWLRPSRQRVPPRLSGDSE